MTKGGCIFWDSITNLCAIYENRPLKCNIDKWHDYSISAIDDGIGFFNQFSNQAFKALSKKINDRAKRCKADFCRYSEEKLNEALDYYYNFLEKHEQIALGEFFPDTPDLPRFRCDAEFQSTEDKVIEVLAAIVVPIVIPYMPDCKKDEVKSSLADFRARMERQFGEYVDEVRRGLRAIG